MDMWIYIYIYVLHGPHPLKMILHKTKTWFYSMSISILIIFTKNVFRNMIRYFGLLLINLQRFKIHFDLIEKKSL